MSDVEVRKNRIINIVYYLILIAAFYLFMNYAFWLCFPFLFAFCVAALLQRPVKAITSKTPLKRGLSSVLCVFILVFVIGTIAYLIGFKLFDELRGFFNYIMLKLENTTKLVEDIENWVTTRISSMPSGLQSVISSAADNLFDSLEKLLAEPALPQAGEAASDQASSGAASGFQISWLTGPLSGVISTASKIPSIVVAVVVSIVASCFFTIDYQWLTGFILNQFSDEKRSNLLRAKTLLKESLSKMGKAYALIIAITFLEMSLGLSVLKLVGVYNSGYILVIALVIAIVDILPILGTGTVIIPWAVVSFILGDIGLGIGLLIIYGVISIIRQIIEPKLVAGQLGLPPIVTLASIFFGLKLFGVLGMFITPILVVMIKTLNDEGIIRFWKPSKDKTYGEGEENSSLIDLVKKKNGKNRKKGNKNSSTSKAEKKPNNKK